MSKLEEINKLLPDNTSEEISPQDIRDAFAKTFDAIEEQVATLPTTATTDEIKQNLEAGNRAIQDALNTKAGVDAENLREEDVAKWKQKLGVGGQVELPSNIATIDDEKEEGNVYTKDKVDELFDIGKNISNTDLKIPEGTVRTLNVEGAKFKISGLANKKTDASFRKKIIVNDRGELAVTDNFEFTMSVPSNLSLNLNVNYTGLTATPPNPTQLEEKVRNLIERLKDVEYIPLLGSNWQENFRDNAIPIRENEYINEVSENGWLNLKVVETNPTQEIGMLILQRTADVELPTNKDWLVRFDINSAWRGWQLGIGELDSLSFGFESGVSKIVNIINGDGISEYASIGLIAKTDNVITSILFAGGRVFVRSEMLNNTANTLKIKARIIGVKSINHWLRTKVHYKILN